MEANLAWRERLSPNRALCLSPVGPEENNGVTGSYLAGGADSEWGRLSCGGAQKDP